MEKVYQLNPTPTGFTWETHDRTDPERKFVRPIYPGSSGADSFTPELQEKMKKFPNRPVVCAKLVPKYSMDLHSLSGLAGYGRFAVVKGEQVLWLDEFLNIYTAYSDGVLCYRVSDPAFRGEVSVTMEAGAYTSCLLLKVDLSAFEPGAEVYFLHGGAMGWNALRPFMDDYEPDMAYRNRVMLRGDRIEINLDAGEYEYEYEGLSEYPYYDKNYSEDCAWVHIKDWQRQIFIRADAAEFFTAGPDALVSFCPGRLEKRNVLGGVACARLTAPVTRFAVGKGFSTENDSIDTLFADAAVKRERLLGGLNVRSGIPELDSTVRIGAIEQDALYAGNAFMHGALSWRYAYLGWRSSYGPLCYGMKDEVWTHCHSHATYGVITEGPDRGAVRDMLEHEAPDHRLCYNMHETFLDQAKKYWEFTGDPEFAKMMAPVLESCMERQIRRLKPTEDWVFENSLNTWISDAHWSMMGQCGQASSYMYNFANWAAEIVPEKRDYYLEMARKIHDDTNRILWQKRKGIFAYCQDTLNNKLLHTQPELADVYHSAEFGMADELQTRQMLDWVESNLKQETTDNGGKLYWSANWAPTAGRSYTHSTYEMALAEELNLAIIFFNMGMAREGYDILKSSYMCVYGGRDPHANEEVANLKKGEAEVIGGFACHITVNGTPRGNASFSDTTSMFGRALYEGMLGVKPRVNLGEMELAPSIPAEIPEISVESAMADYDYARRDGSVSLKYRLKADVERLLVKLYIPVGQVLSVTAGGEAAGYTAEPFYDQVRVNLVLSGGKEGEILLTYRDAAVAPVEARRTVHQGETLSASYEGEEILSLNDPQGLLSNVRIAGGTLTAAVTGEPGSGVFFLRMRKDGTEYIRTVKVLIPDDQDDFQPFLSPAAEFEGPLNWQTVPMDGLFNVDSPANAMQTVHDNHYPMPGEYNLVNLNYYKDHINGRTKVRPGHEVNDSRWRGLVDENGIAMTGEGIPFRSKKTGNYLAATTLASDCYPDGLNVPVNAAGRAVYLLVSGVTFPMQSHVENLRIRLNYADGETEVHSLQNPRDIGDMWENFWLRYHDTPGAGFENISGQNGVMSSAGQDLTACIPTDTEAHILRFRLREGVELSSVDFTTICDDAIFCLMGVTVLK